MPRRVEILSKKRVFERFIFRIDEVRLRHETYAGTMSEPITRLNLDRGDSTAALMHDPRRGMVILTEQFRYPTHEKGPGWLLELPAGVVEDGEAPDSTMRRELEEETGYHIEQLEHISTFYVSPGGTSERIHLYYATYQPTDALSTGGGLDSEDEDIRVIEMPLAEALAKMDDGTIADAKTIMALQWLRLKQNAV